MGYIAVDLKVIEGLAGQVARAAGTSEDRVLAGLVRLWHRCWSSTTETVNRVQLAGIMGSEGLDSLADALCQHGFLEATAETWRVRGAQRYLRLKASRAAGAKKTNETRRKARSRASTSDAPARSRASLSDAQATLPNALSPSTEHREVKASAPMVVLTRDSDALCQDFKDIMGTAYVWQGAKDGVALAELRKSFSLEEIRVRWQRGLRAPADAWASCRTVAQLRLKVNDLAAAPAKVSIEHQPSRMFK